MGFAILLLLASLLVTLIVGIRTIAAGVRRLTHEVILTREELRSLRLASRARVGSVRYDGDSEMAVLRRLGRDSAAKRVVVGGEDESEQKRGLMRRWEGGSGGKDD